MLHVLPAKPIIPSSASARPPTRVVEPTLVHILRAEAGQNENQHINTYTETDVKDKHSILKKALDLSAVTLQASKLFRDGCRVSPKKKTVLADIAVHTLRAWFGISRGKGARERQYR